MTPRLVAGPRRVCVGRGCLGRDERVRGEVVEAEDGEAPPRAVEQLGEAVRRGRCELNRDGDDGRQAVQPDKPGDFLDHIDLARHVGPPRRHDDAQHVAIARRLEADGLEQAPRLVRRHGDAEQALDARQPKLDGRRFERRGDDVRDARRERPAGDVGQQGRRPRRGAELARRVDAALEAVARVRREAEALRGAAHARRVEHGGLDEQARRLGADLGRLPAHDAGHGDRRLVVRDDERALGQVSPNAVERHERLSGQTPPDDHDVAQLVEVEGVERLAGLVEHPVRHVHDVVDGADADRGEALDQPRRARPDGHVFNDEGRVARAAGRVLDEDLDRQAGARVRHLDGRQRQRGAGERGEVAGDARVARRVRPVRRHVDVQHGVAAAEAAGVEVVREGHAGRGLCEDQDAVVARADAQLILGADHAHGRLAADLGLLDRDRLQDARIVARRQLEDRPDGRDRDGLALRHVRRAAHDLDRIVRADVDEADAQAVCPVVRPHVQDVPDDHAVERRPRLLDALDFEAGHREQGRDLIGRLVRIDEVREPGGGNEHGGVEMKLGMDSRRSPVCQNWVRKRRSFS